MAAKGKKNEDKVFNAGDVVLTKVKGFREWPSKVVADNEIPPQVAAQRKSKSGYCVRFFPTGDYAFVTGKDMHLLEKPEITAFLSQSTKKTRQDLIEGYRIALDPVAWEKEINEAQDEEENSQDYDQENEASKQTEGEEPPFKKKRTNNGSAKATAVATTSPATEEKSPSSANNSSTIFENLQDASEEDRHRLVFVWRGRLQRAFLKDEPHSEEQVLQAVKILKSIKKSGMLLEWVGNTKLHIVIRKIIKLEDTSNIPGFEKYKVRERAQAIQDMWKSQELAKAESEQGGAKREALPSSGESKTENANSEEAKSEDSKADEPKSDEPKSNEPTSEESKSNEPTSEESKPNEPKPEELKSDEPKADESKPDENKSEEIKPDDNSAEITQSENQKPEDLKAEELKSE